MEKITAESYRSNLIYVITFLTAFLVFQTFLGMAFIPSASMEPTLHVGNKYPFFAASYWFKDPQKGDIVVFDDEGTVYCKRIIGEPGDEITFSDGDLYINGEKQVEPYVAGKTYPYEEDRYVVPEGEYFFMGDNRENSHDSRLWYYPYLTKDKILGRIFIIKK